MSSAAQVLSPRAVNRALLARQLLLERQVMASAEPDRAAQVVQAIEHLVGLQAQAPFPPYYGLHSRLDGFRPGDLAALITDRSVVRIALMRGTIHLVSARDCLALRRLVQPVIERGAALGLERNFLASSWLTFSTENSSASNGPRHIILSSCSAWFGSNIASR